MRFSGSSPRYAAAAGMAGLALVLVLAAVTLPVLAAGGTFKIVVSLPETESKVTSGTVVSIQESLKVALDQVNAWAGANGNHTFQLDFKDTGKSLAPAVKSVFDAAKDGAVGLIGEKGSTITIPMALAANQFQMWQCSGSATSPTLSNKAEYRYFYRTIPPDSVQGAFIARFVRLMGWRSVAILFTGDSYGQGIMTTFSNEAVNQEITITTSQSFTASDVQADYTHELDAIQSSGTRIVVFLGTTTDFISIARHARARGMIAADWVWIGSDGVNDLADTLYAQGNKYSDTDRENSNGVLVAFPTTQGPQFQAFWSAYQAKYPGRQGLAATATLFADCLQTMARGIVKLAGSIGVDKVNQRAYPSSMTVKDFVDKLDGVSGAVSFDENADRIADYTLRNLWNGQSNVVYTLAATASASLTASSTAVKFFGGSSSTPPDRPSSMLAYVTYKSIGGIIIMGIDALLILTVIAATIYLYTQREHASVKSMALFFLLQISLGIVMVLATIFLWIDVPTTLTCNLQTWMFVIGLQLVLSAVAAKAYRIFKVFDNRQLAKLHKLSDTRLFLGCIAILLIQTGISAAWTLVAPLEPTLMATATSVSYKCASRNATLDTLFQTITLVYNALLLGLVTVLAFHTRKAYSLFRESKFIAYTAQNIFLCGVVVTPFLYLATESFALAAWFIKTFVVMYAAGFSFAALVGRIALVPYMESKKAAKGSGVKMSYSGDNGSSNDGTSSAEHMPGKMSTMSGKYPVKVANKLFETWHTNRITLFALEGFLGITRLTNNTEQGTLFKLRSLQFDPDPPSYPMCIEIRADSKSYCVQFAKNDDKQKWVKALSVHCLVFSKSGGGSSRGNGTTNVTGGPVSGPLSTMRMQQSMNAPTASMVGRSMGGGAAMGRDGNAAWAAAIKDMAPAPK
ncbi:Metabotropic glutamate receptor 2 [Allomyces javanicus]|nr:Metabotropic glutamate receptor 2 [Allomyces javanicus]